MADPITANLAMQPTLTEDQVRAVLSSGALNTEGLRLAYTALHLYEAARGWQLVADIERERAEWRASWAQLVATGSREAAEDYLTDVLELDALLMLMRENPGRAVFSLQLWRATYSGRHLSDRLSGFLTRVMENPWTHPPR